VDLVIFVGPVIVKPAFRTIPWERPTEIVAIAGSGSSYFGSLGAQLRDADGRVIPNLLRRHAGVDRSEIDRLALCAWSAGWGLLNQCFKDERDRRDVNACIASDAAFGTGLTGYEKYAADAINGDALMVATTTNNSANPALGIMKTARETWTETQANAISLSGCRCEPREVSPRDPMPAASGGVWRTGRSLYWYDYVEPGSPAGHGNDFSHAEHHDLAVEAWTAYLVDYPSAMPWPKVVGGGLAVAGLGAAVYIWRTS
jgi:hypothetical protein